MAEQIGIQLQHLELVCLRESLDLAQVARQCPNLQILEIYYSQAVHVSSPMNFRFGKLHKLIIYSTDILGPDAQQDIFLCCPNVKKLTICKCDRLDDIIICDLLQTKPLQKCEVLCLLQAPNLTIDIARILVNQLPNLRFIGRLDSWEMSWSQVEQLRFEINQYNLDVILWESFSTLERQNAFEDHDYVDVEFNPDNADELIGERN